MRHFKLKVVIDLELLKARDFIGEASVVVIFMLNNFERGIIVNIIIVDDFHCEYCVTTTVVGILLLIENLVKNIIIIIVFV